VIEEILPAPVAAVEAYDDPPGADLFPEEETVIRRAVDKRRREFTTARVCARAALARIGVPPAPILPGTRGAPGWPPGVVGSMTHCPGYRAAAVAHDADITTLGLDAEPNEPLPDGVRALVIGAGERDGLRALGAAAPAVCGDRLLFSAKESVYKAWFPLTGRMLDFDEAYVVADGGPSAGAFTARLLVPGPAVGRRRLDGFTGRWLVRDGLIVTAITVAPGGPA
jgi:4'-phosphopantetheinyl transferase EntD